MTNDPSLTRVYMGGIAPDMTTDGIYSALINEEKPHLSVDPVLIGLSKNKQTLNNAGYGFLYVPKEKAPLLIDIGGCGKIPYDNYGVEKYLTFAYPKDRPKKVI